MWIKLHPSVEADHETDPCVLVLLHDSRDIIINSITNICCDNTVWKGEAAIVRRYQVAGWILYHCNNIIYNSNSFSNKGQLAKLLGDDFKQYLNNKQIFESYQVS